MAVVVLALLGTWSWIKSLDDAHIGDASEPVGGTFRPPPGRYVSEVITDDGGHVQVPLEVVQLDDDRVELRMPWRPPEPALEPMPPLLAAHADRIPLRITVVATGQVEDVVGPDDLFDPLDESDPDTADQLRALLLEEQIDAVLGWQLTAWVSQPLLEQTRFSFEAAMPGYAMRPGWSGTIDYAVGPAAACPEAAIDEQCAPITLTSRPGADGRTGITGELVVGLETGVEWQATLVRDAGDRRREVRRRLIPVNQ